MTVYCGVDFHARLQTVRFLDTSDGELHQQDLHHQKDDIRAFYSQFGGEVIVGLEASAYSRWFEQMLEELGHQVLIGDAAVTLQAPPGEDADDGQEQPARHRPRRRPLLAVEDRDGQEPPAAPGAGVAAGARRST